MVCEHCNEPVEWFRHWPYKQGQGKWIHSETKDEECLIVLYAYPKEQV